MIGYSNRSFQTRSTENILHIFLGIWLLINLLQASLTGLHEDEPYYWLYAKFLSWGYFDHPPMIAVFIKTGSYLFKNTLGLRLVTVITTTVSIYFLWLLVKEYASNIRLFILLFCSVIIFNLYSFITTPDAPLFFFSVMLLYAYKQYIKAYTWAWAFALGILSAAILYSKYHGILIIFFIVLSNLSLFKKTSFWAAMAITLLLFAPHIYWQYQNDYPSLRYHIFERTAGTYKLQYTLQYILDQALMTGPLMGWYLILHAVKQKIKADQFLRCLQFIVYGVFIFFFFSSFKGRVEAHWPLIEFIPLFILAYIHIAGTGLKPVYKILFILNIILLFSMRLLSVIAPGNLKKVSFIQPYYGYEEWTKIIKTNAGSAPVIFEDGFQLPSYYNFYSRDINAYAYNSYTYRKTQYDLWPIEDSLHHKKVYYVLRWPHKGNYPQTRIITPKGIFYGAFIDHVRMYQKLNFVPVNYSENWKNGEQRKVTFDIYNPYNENISFSDKDEEWKCTLYYGFYHGQVVTDTIAVKEDFRDFNIPPKGTHPLTILIKAPEQPGEYKLFISVRTEPFNGSRNSKKIHMEVE